MNSIPLNPDVIQHIGSYLNPRQVVAFTQVNKNIRANSDELLRQQFRETFGKIDPAYQPDKTVMARLLSCVEKYALYPLTLRPPNRGVERWKWLAGVENSFDKEIREVYNQNIRLLENTFAKSFIQMKHKMRAFRHAYRPICARRILQIRRKLEIGRLRLIARIFLVCLRFFFRLFCRPSFLNDNSLLKRRQTASAKIGGFHCNGKDYDVVALYNPVRGPFLYIFKRAGLHSGKEHLGNHNFDVLRGRELIKMGWYSGRHLLICLNPTDAYESNRSLDQKLIQIGVEIAMQNKNMKNIQCLRIEDGNGLNNLLFSCNAEDFTKRNVSHSGGVTESWSDIIQRKPILEPGCAAILPWFD